MMPRLVLRFAGLAGSLPAVGPAPEAARHRRVVTTSGETYAARLAGAVRNRWVAIAHVGAKPVDRPWVVANGKRDWFSTADLLSGLLTPAMTERERALAIWRFLVANRYRGAPAHAGIERHDPVRFLNVYGYGFCDDAATNFLVLAEQAGLRARVWGLSGHVVPEAFFEGDGRMLDPAGEIFYLEDDSRSIAGVKTLARRPDLIHKYPSPYYKDSGKIASD